MPSSFTPLLKLELPATGELSGTWGTTVNNAITTPLSEAVAGTTTITVGGSDYTLSNGDGSAANEARKMFIVATGTPGASRNVICPAASKFYVFRNDTNQTLTLKTLSGTGIAVPAGQYRFLYCDGTNVVETFNAMASLTLGAALAAASGGTGQASYTTGDLLYATGATALSKLGIGTNGQILTSTGTAPQWSTLSGVAVTTFSAGTTGFTPNSATSGAVTLAGTLATTNGGTGLTSFTANGVVYASSTSALATGSALTFDGTKALTVGTGTATQRASVTLDGGANAGVGAVYGINIGGSLIGGMSNSGYAAADTSTDLAIFGDTGKSVRFYANASEQMRLTSTGLGIGTSSPGAKLGVTSPAATAAAGAWRSGSTDSVYMSLGRNAYEAGIGVTGSTVLLTGASAGDLNIYTALAGASIRFGSGNGVLAATLDSSGNLGLGVTPSAWGNTTALQLKKTAASNIEGALYQGAIGANNANGISYNAYYNGTTWQYIFGTSHPASRYEQSQGAHAWHIAASGTGTVSFTQAMTLDASGNLGVGITNPAYRFDVEMSSGPYVTRFYNSNSSTNQYNVSLWGQAAAGSAIGYVGTGGSAVANNAFVNTFVVGTQTSSALVFNTADTERARITSGGDLLVGTTTNVGNAKLKSKVSAGVTGLEITDEATSDFIVVPAISANVCRVGPSAGAMAFYSGNSERARIPAAGGMVVGTAALATSATDGFLYVPTCAGTPTGTPTTQTGTAPIVVDTTNNKLYFYSGGQWRDAGP
jgi:hypothetical protein